MSLLENDDALIEAAMFGRVDQVKALLALGYVVNKKNDLGWTPLHWGAINGHIDVCGLLIKHGAEVNKTDNAGDTPLDFAAASGHPDVCNALIHSGADVNVQDNYVSCIDSVLFDVVSSQFFRAGHHCIGQHTMATKVCVDCYIPAEPI
eukprot:c6537_g1_i5.p1 GENE.c6537_g1_i5~~c6537_g1_i5.p1  ORF type:complete len:149 (-),score=12.72 c6537_g1_i5:385-831(-)